MNYKKHSQKREESLSKDIKGTRHVASGAFWFKRGDFSSEFFLGEDKFTTKDSYTLSLDVLHKLKKQARKVDKIPLFTLGFKTATSEDTYVFVQSVFLAVPYPSLVPRVDTNKKSYTIKHQILRDWYLKSMSDVIGILSFDGKSTTEPELYYILHWREFKENYPNLISKV